MTKTGPARAVDDDFHKGRLDNARAYLHYAEQAALLSEPGANANPIVSHIVNAALGYADALTAAFGGVVNRSDHAAAPKTLRAVLGNRLPRAQENRLARMLREKDAAQYGARSGRLDHANSLLGELRDFAAWAEGALADR